MSPIETALALGAAAGVGLVLGAGLTVALGALGFLHAYRQFLKGPPS